MRIAFLVVFYIATYVAKIANGDEIARTMPESGINHILRQKNGTIRDVITGKLIDDEMTRETNKRREQSLLIHRIDGLLQNRKILNVKLARVKRSLREGKKPGKNSDIVHHRKENDINDDIDEDIGEKGEEEEEDSLSVKTRGFPIWQVSEPIVVAIDLNSTANPTIRRSSFVLKKPLSENLNPYRFSNKATSLIATDRHPNSHRFLDTNVSEKNLIFSKFSNSKSNIRNSVYKKPIDELPLFVYPPEISVISPNSKSSREFERRLNGYPKDFSDQRNIKNDFSNNHLTDSNERFLLVPVSKDLYILKNVQDNLETSTDKMMIIPKRHKLLERNRNKENATSAILSFKAHMHHDVKDVGRAYLHHRTFGNRYLSDRDINYLYADLKPRIVEENMENLTSLSYPNFSHPGISFQTYSDLIETAPKILDQQITLRVPDYKYISSVDIDSNTEIVRRDSSTISTTSSFIDMSYDVSSKENANDYRSNILPAIKLDELNSTPDSIRYENSLECSELSVESTTTDFQNIFDNLGDDTDILTLKNVEMDDNKELFDTSKNIKNKFQLSMRSNKNKNRINFTGNISTQYKSAFDSSVNKNNHSFPNYFFADNNENILNNQDTNENNVGSGILISNEYDDKKSTYSNNFNYNKFINETFFGNYTTIKLDSFLNVEDYSTSTSLLSNIDEWSKKKQINIGNPRAILKAIEPLSTELKTLLTAVKLVNQSISNVQNRLCNKKNVRSTRIQRENKERKATNITESIYNKKGKNIVDRKSNDVGFKKKTTNAHFLYKFTTLQKHKDSVKNNRKTNSNNRRNFHKKRKLSEFPKSDNIKKRGSSHLRLNRNIKSFAKSYKVQPIRQFLESGLKRAKRTTPIVISLHRLIENNNVSSRNNFTNGRIRNYRENKSISSSIFSDTSASKNDRVNFLLNNKRDLTGFNVTSKLSGDEEKKYHSVDPQYYREATAYLDVLRLLNMTKKPYVEHSTDIAANVTETLVSATEFFLTTATVLSYPIERSTTIEWKEESSEANESVLYDYLTSTDYEYYEEQNYTGIYEDRDVTSWYEYVEGTTIERRVISTTPVKDLITKFVETTREVEITMSTKKKIDYEVVETISLTQLSVTLSAFTITMPSTLSQFHTRELSIFPIDEEVFTIEETTLTVAMLSEVTEISIVIPTTLKTTESLILLTPLLEGMTDITLRITIPTVTSRTSIEESPTITVREIIESTSTTLTMEVTQSFSTEINTSLITISTVPSFTTTEIVKMTIQITTPTVVSTPLTLAKKYETTTAIEKIISVTESMITSVSSTMIPIKSTTILGEITYVTKIETEIKDVTSLITQALTFTTHIPTRILKTTEEISLVTENIKTVSIENTTTTENTRIITPSITQIVSTLRVTESTTKTLIIINKTVAKYTITAITSSPTTLKRAETILSASTEIVTTILTSEEESPVTQIEKTITAEEVTTTETPTTIETTTKIPIISETSTFNETSTSSITTTSIKVPSTISTETLLTTIETTVTKILMSFGISTIHDILSTENRTITKLPMTTEISTPSITPTTIKVSSTISTETLLTTIETTVTKILSSFGISTIREILSTENRTIAKPPTTTEISTLTEISVTTEIQTTVKTLIITETIESTSTSSVIPISITAIKTIPTITTISKTTIPITSLKFITTTSLSIVNVTLKETPCTTISSTFSTTTVIPIITAFAKTTVPLKLTTITTILSLVTNATLTETPCTISTIFFTEKIETTTFPVTSTEVFTTKILPTTLSTLITTMPFLNTSIAINKTLFTTIFTTFEIVTIETTTLSMPLTTTSIFKATTRTTLTPSIVNTTLREITLSTFSTEIIESTTLTSVSLTTEIASTTNLVELATKERIATWITTERPTITKITTLMTHVPLSTTMTFVEITAETTLFVTEAVTVSSEQISTIEEVTAISFTTITEESSLSKEVTNITSITIEISIPTKMTLTFTETSISAMETSIANTSLASVMTTTVMTTASFLREDTTEIVKTSLIITTTTTTTLLSITEKPELIETEMTLTPLSEFTSSVLIASEIPATTSEIISILPKTITEEREFTTILTSPSKTYTLESLTTSSIERTVQPTVSTLVVITKEMPEIETEYYATKMPLCEEDYKQYEEYDTEIPTNEWYDYEEYETTVKIKTTKTPSTAKYTKIFKETAGPSVDKETTFSYETKTLEFTMYSTTSASIYIDAVLTVTSARRPSTEEEFTSISALETSAMTIIENTTTIEMGTEFITFVTSKEEESTTTALTFGSTEEYTLLPSTIFEIMTKPLEYLTIPAKYTEPASKFFTQTRYDATAIKFFTKPKEILELEKTSTSKGILTEIEFTVEKLTSFFVSSTLTTLSESEAIGMRVTTASTAFSEIETAIEIDHEATTLATTLITKEKIALYTTMFVTSEIETEFITMRQTTLGREEERKRLLQLFDDLEQREREVAKKEEMLKEKERQWEKKKHKEMMQREKEKIKNITLMTGITASYFTTITSTQNLTVGSTIEIEVTPLVLDTSSFIEIVTTSTETTPLYVTEKDTFATFITERTEETTTKESAFSTYSVEVPEKTATLHTTEESTSVTYISKETKEMHVTNYTTLTSFITASVIDLYNISSVSIETTTIYTEEMYTTSYETAYLSEPLFTSPTMAFTSPITLAIDEFITLPTVTFSSYEIGAISITIPTSITEEKYITSYVTLYSELPFTWSTMTLTSQITEREAIDITISVTTPISYTTKEIIDIYNESLFASSASMFIKTTTALTVSTTTEIGYDEDIESLKEKLREKERELEEREKMLLKREERLKKDIIEFELYMREMEKKEMHALTESFEKSIAPTSLSTPVPPTEKTVIKVQVTTQIEKGIEKKENQTTTKIVTSHRETTKVKDIEEIERTKHVPEKATTEIEKEFATKRICLNVLENTTIPFVIKKMCLPYFPENNKEQRSVGRLSRKPLSISNMREIRKSKFQNFSSDFRYRGVRRTVETTRKIDNLQLSYDEWLSNETMKPTQCFKGFTRIYEKKKKPSLKKTSITINMQENSIYNSRDKTPLYERRILDPYESLGMKSTTIFMLNNKRKRNAFLIPARKNNFSNQCIVKRNVSSTVKNIRAKEDTINVSNKKTTSMITKKENLDEKENESYTVNVLHLSYNKDKETYEVISAKPNENELTVIMYESNDDNNVTEFEKDGKITTPSYELEEKNDLQEEEKLEEEDDSFEDMLENYMNYEERTASIPIRDDKFSDDKDENKSKIENEITLLDQAWPTEKSTTYHLGGTRFWELEVTEPSIIFSITTEESKTIDLSVTRTTCLYVVLKNEINIDAKTKRNTHHRKRNIYDNKTRKYNISIEKRKGFKNITSESRQNLRGSNRYERNSGKRKLDEFSHIKDSIIVKTRKLCSANENESKRQKIKHKDTTNIRNKTKKEQLTKSQNTNLRSTKSCTDNCIANKKKSDKIITRTTANHYSQAKNSNNKENDKKITNNGIAADRTNQSVYMSCERKNHDYLNCICDIANVIENVKSILNKISFSLNEIRKLNCSVHKDTQDKIVISMDSDAEETTEFSQSHYNTESLKGQKYIKLEELEDDFRNDLEFGNDHDIVSLPGLNLNLPCNQDGDGITWLSSISRPSYAWKRNDGNAIFGFVAENGDLELQNINAKDMGNYTCVMTYMGPETEELVETNYEVRLQVVTLPRYIVRGENRYYTRSCDERDLDILVTYLPTKLNNVICEADICSTYILTPSCSRNQITINILLMPSHIVKFMTIDPKHCNVFCLKAIQDKLSLILSKNLQIFLGKTIIFRLPHYEQRLVPIAEKSTFARWKRGRTNGFAGRTSNIGLFSSCPAGYGLRGTHCVPCNMGTYSEDGISYCKKCPPGTYQPNHGARVCRTCTDPLTRGCYNMLWSSFSAIMVTLASLGAMLSIFLLFLWIICCVKKKFCVKRIASIIPKEDLFEQEDPIEQQSLIKDVSENQDGQWDNEYKAKKKRKKFYLNKKRRKQNENGKYEKIRIHEDEWGSHRIKNTPNACPDSYRSHEDFNNYYSKRSYRKGPRLPECDFDT